MLNNWYWLSEIVNILTQTMPINLIFFGYQQLNSLLD
jgi:hypothetical protein